jgi:hypothetical protein
MLVACIRSTRCGGGRHCKLFAAWASRAVLCCTYDVGSTPLMAVASPRVCVPLPRPRQLQIQGSKTRCCCCHGCALMIHSLPRVPVAGCDCVLCALIRGAAWMGPSPAVMVRLGDAKKAASSSVPSDATCVRGVTRCGSYLGSWSLNGVWCCVACRCLWST